MTLNIYWPIFKNIEKEFENLLYNIHLDDDQLNVYSSKITDLLLRTSTEIESISKELYIQNGGKLPDNNYLNFEDAIKHLNGKFKIEEKTIIINSYNCFLTNKVIQPFKKNTKRTGKNRMTYNWNNAYQNLKHNRFESLKFGSIENLLHGLAALFILNVYFKNEKFYLGNDYNLSRFDLSIGSSLFSASYHKEPEFHHREEYMKGEKFNESLFLVIPDPSLYKKLKETLKKLDDSKNELLIEYVKRKPLTNDNQNGVIDNFKIDFSTNSKIFKEFQLPGLVKHGVELKERTSIMKYWLELNKNQI